MRSVDVYLTDVFLPKIGPGTARDAQVGLAHVRNPTSNVKIEWRGSRNFVGLRCRDCVGLRCAASTC